MGIFSKGKCIRCGREVGMFSARKCTNPGCGKMFCYDCCDKAGFLNRNTICPICGNPADQV